MNPRIAIGTGALAFGLVCSLFGALFLVLGIRSDREMLIVRGRRLGAATLIGALVAVGAMEWALLSHDFGIQYVADNNSVGTPLLYTVTGLWASLEGSILLWVAILAGYVTYLIVRTGNRAGQDSTHAAVAIALLVTAFFFVLLLAPANPFAATEGVVPADGRGPNPLLANNALMAIHPPMLYLGYVGFVIPFALTIGGLLRRNVDESWLIATRRSTLFAWSCLTIGIMLGAWWSYAVLGWGGYWAWDPVENASLLPWLTGTALLHSMMVQEQRPAMRVWNVSLVISTFALTILGTFLTRSGIVASVHAFSQSPIAGWLLALLAAVTVGGLGLVMARGDALQQIARPRKLFSREGAFAANNLAFSALAVVVLLGTVFPIVAQQFGDDELTIGPPYFDRFAAPLGLVLLFLMAVAPMLPWGAASLERVESKLVAPAVAGTFTVVSAVAAGSRNSWALAGFGLAAFAGTATLAQMLSVLRTSRLAGGRRSSGMTRRRLGGMTVHLGVVLIAVAITATQEFASKDQVTLTPDSSQVVKGYRVSYEGRTVQRESDRLRIRANLKVSERGEDPFKMSPSVSVFTNANQAIGNPAIATGWTRDLYITLVSSPTSSDKVEITVAVNPMVRWLWVGGGVIGFGSLLAIAGTRRGRQDLEESDG